MYHDQSPDRVLPPRRRGCPGSPGSGEKARTSATGASVEPVLVTPFCANLSAFTLIFSCGHHLCYGGYAYYGTSLHDEKAMSHRLAALSTGVQMWAKPEAGAHQFHPARQPGVLLPAQSSARFRHLIDELRLSHRLDTPGSHFHLLQL